MALGYPLGEHRVVLYNAPQTRLLVERGRPVAVKPDFGKIISAHSFAMRLNVGYALLPVGAGVLLSYSNVIGGEEIYSTVGGVVTAAIGVLPGLAIPEHFKRIRAIGIVSDLWDTVHSKDPADPKHAARLEEMFWKMLEKEALG